MRKMEKDKVIVRLLSPALSFCNVIQTYGKWRIYSKLVNLRDFFRLLHRNVLRLVEAIAKLDMTRKLPTISFTSFIHFHAWASNKKHNSKMKHKLCYFLFLFKILVHFSKLTQKRDRKKWIVAKKMTIENIWNCQVNVVTNRKTPSHDKIHSSESVAVTKIVGNVRSMWTFIYVTYQRQP